MYKLQTDNAVFYRVKENQTAEEISREFGRPVFGEVFNGAIVTLAEGNFTNYTARVGESFASIAAKLGVDEAELEKLNEGPVYPTRTLIVPCRSD